VIYLASEYFEPYQGTGMSLDVALAGHAAAVSATTRGELPRIERISVRLR
jgi:hypothetical protein